MSEKHSFHHYVDYGSDDSVSSASTSNFAMVSELSDNSYLEWFKKAQV